MAKEQRTLERINSDLEDIEFELMYGDLSDIQQLKKSVKKLNNDLNMWKLFEEIIISYNYEKSINRIIINLNKTKYKSRVDSFRNNSKISSDIFLPLNEKKYSNKEWRNHKIQYCTTCLKNFKEFFDTAKGTSIDTQPILYYYSVAYLFSFLINSFIEIQKPKKHHGIYVSVENNLSEYQVDGKKINEIKFKYNQGGGFLNRLVHTLSIIQYPSYFSEFITDFNDSNCILRSQTTELSISNSNEILLNNLVKHDFNEDCLKIMNEIQINWLLDDFQERYEKTSNIIRDIILIFISSYLARYHPIWWKQIYLGEKSDLIFYFKRSFENINNMIILVNGITKEAENNDFQGFHGTMHEFF